MKLPLQEPPCFQIYGIPAADLPNLFKRFYRVRNNGHAHIENNGLRLAIVKSIIQQHGGDVTVENEAGKGSCFTVQLPTRSTNEFEETTHETKLVSNLERR